MKTMAANSRRDDLAEFLGGTPEQVAYNLLRDIAHAEKREYRGGPSYTDSRITKQWILNTYKECLAAVRNPD
jgi:hypothetical protein